MYILSCNFTTEDKSPYVVLKLTSEPIRKYPLSQFEVVNKDKDYSMNYIPLCLVCVTYLTVSFIFTLGQLIWLQLWKFSYLNFIPHKIRQTLS